MKLSSSVLEQALEELDTFEHEQTDPFAVELSIVLYGSGVNLRKIRVVLDCIGVERSHVAVSMQDQ